MKRKNLIASVLLLLSVGINTLNAQEEKASGDTIQRQPPTGYIALNIGVGTATGNFGNKNIGGALSGNAYQLSIFTPFQNSYFGLGAKFNYGTYAMSNQPLFAQQMAVNKQFGLDTAVKFKSNIKQNITQMTLMVGMFGTLPMLHDDKLSLDVRALFGPTVINRPGLSIDSIGGVHHTTTYTQSASKSNSFVVDFGMSVRYNVLKSKKLCVMISFDYLKSNVNFEVESKSKYTTDSNVLKEGVHTEKLSYSINYYDITAGIGYVW